MEHGQLSLMPLAIELDHGKKVCITEADLENYPVCIFSAPILV